MSILSTIKKIANIINTKSKDFRNRRERDKLKSGVLKNVLFLVTDKVRLFCGTAGEYSQIFWGYL